MRGQDACGVPKRESPGEHHNWPSYIQFHEKKLETIYVLNGSLTIELNKEIILLKPSESITISVGQVHRMSAVDADVLYLESSTPELDDVVRVEDDFGRS